MKLKSDRKIYVIIALCAILLVMSIGYAAFSSLLTINGTASLSDSFCVGFDNTKTNTYVPTTGITNGTLPTGSMSYSGTACSTSYQPNSSLSATFKQPGDKIEYTLTIANKSTFTVAIESILVENQSVTSNTTITKGNIKYTVEMPLTTTLASNAETTMKITAMFQNDTAVTGQYSGESQTINVKINAEQGDSGFTPTPSSFTGTIYRNNTTEARIGSSIMPLNGSMYVITNGTYTSPAGPYDTEEACAAQRNTLLEQGMPESYTCQQQTGTYDGIGEYTTDASTLNKTYYLKHDVVNNIITATYACFVTDTEHCMKGADDGISYSTNKALLQGQETWFNNHLGSCSFGDSDSSCYVGGSCYVGSNSNGGAHVGVSSCYYCEIFSSYNSRCHVPDSGGSCDSGSFAP